MERKDQEAPQDQQDLQEKVGLAVLGPLALLDQGVHLVIWGCLDPKVLLASLDIVTPPRVLPTVWELPIRISQNSPLSKMRMKPWNCGDLGSDSLRRNLKTNNKNSQETFFKKVLLLGLYAILGGLISAVLIILKLPKEEINKKVYPKHHLDLWHHNSDCPLWF